MTVQAVILGMLDLLDEGRGWYQGGMRHWDAAEHRMRYCIIGASEKVAIDVSLAQDVRERIGRVLPDGCGIVAFNDMAPNFGPVQAVLRAAIEGGK